MIDKILFILILVIGSTAFAAETKSKGILPLPLISQFQIAQVHEYTCGRNMQCQIRCSSQPDELPFEYQNVRRLELAASQDYWIVGAVYVDPVGKAHSATAILSQPVSCILDDLELSATMPVEEGGVIRPSAEDEVIFDMVPLD